MKMRLQPTPTFIDTDFYRDDRLSRNWKAGFYAGWATSRAEVAEVHLKYCCQL